MFGSEDEIRDDWHKDIRNIIKYVKENCPEHLEGLCGVVGHPPIDFYFGGGVPRLDGATLRSECFCGFMKNNRGD